MTSETVPQATGLQFHFAIHSKKDIYKSGYFVKEEPSRYKG